MLWHLSPEKTLGLGTELLPGSIWGFLEDNLQNVTQKAGFMRKKKDGLPELSRTSGGGAVVVLIWV